MHAVDRPGLCRRSRTAMRRSCRKVRMAAAEARITPRNGRNPSGFRPPRRFKWPDTGRAARLREALGPSPQAPKPLLHEVLFAAALPGLRLDQAAGGHHVDRARIVEPLRVLAAQRAEFRGLFGGL